MESQGAVTEQRRHQTHNANRSLAGCVPFMALKHTDSDRMCLNVWIEPCSALLPCSTNFSRSGAGSPVNCLTGPEQWPDVSSLSCIHDTRRLGEPRKTTADVCNTARLPFLCCHLGNTAFPPALGLMNRSLTHHHTRTRFMNCCVYIFIALSEVHRAPYT